MSEANTKIKSLDGVRAVAVMLVLCTHAVNSPGVEVPLIHGSVVDSMFRGMGRLGVMAFFVLSGYLITTLLVREYHRTGSVSLGRFWYRRAFRIFPVFYAFLGVVTFLVVKGILDIKANVISVAATYAWNYQFLFIDGSDKGSNSGVIGHLWTLSVEEQFYLFFPFVFLLLGPRRSFWACLVLVVCTPAIRLGQYFIFPDLRDYGSVMGHTMFGVSIAIGCLWALAEYLGHGKRVRNFLSEAPAFYFAMTFCFVIHPFLEVILGGKWSLPIGESLVGVGAMSMIAYVVRYSDTSLCGRFLNIRLVAWFGTISYSLYIWQQLIFHFEISVVPLIWSRFLLAILAVVVACLSYYLLEMPCLRLRDRLWNPTRKANQLVAENKLPVSKF